MFGKKDAESLVVEGKGHARFDLTGSVSLRKQLEEYFEEPVIRIATQMDIHQGFDEMFVMLKGGTVFKCLVQGGVQASDWIVAQPEGGRK